jgi:hypothetical protein
MSPRSTNSSSRQPNVLRRIFTVVFAAASLPHTKFT